MRSQVLPLSWVGSSDVSPWRTRGSESGPFGRRPAFRGAAGARPGPGALAARSWPAPYTVASERSNYGLPGPMQPRNSARHWPTGRPSSNTQRLSCSVHDGGGAGHQSHGVGPGSVGGTGGTSGGGGSGIVGPVGPDATGAALNSNRPMASAANSVLRTSLIFVASLVGVLRPAVGGPSATIRP